MRSTTIHTPVSVAVGLFAWGLLAPTLVAAQVGIPAGGGEVAGHVIESGSRAPIGGALVVLSPDPAGVFVSPDAGGQTSALRTQTDASGAYRFSNIPPGDYALRVTHIGYASAELLIALERGAGPRVTIGLVIEPVELEPLHVVEEGAQPLALPPGQRPDSISVSTVRLRQRRYLETDVRALTTASVDASIAFLEPDLFRTLQRLPGVSARDEYLAEPWVRAAPWGRTRTYLDGVPLFDPLHLGGVLTSIPPDAVGAGFLHMGVRPTELGEGSAGVINFASRKARERPGIPLQTEVTFTGIRAVTERRFLGGRAGVVAGARRSLIDKAVAIGGGDDPEGPFDYALSSWFVHGDARLSDDADISFTRLSASDRVAGNVMSLIQDTDASWGSDISKLSLRTKVGDRVRATLTVAGSDFGSQVSSAPDPSITPVDPDVVALTPSASQVRYRAVQTSIADARHGGSRGRWAAGLDLIRQSFSQSGGAAVVTSVDDVPSSEGGRLEYVSAWGRATFAIGPAWELEGGLRADFYRDPVIGQGDASLAPSVTARGRVGAGWTLSASAGRSYLYAQQVGSAGTSFGPAFHIGHRWLLAGTSAPAQQTDILSLGAERWLSPSWLLSVTGFGRRSTGVATDFFTDFTATTFPADLARERAFGIEGLVRKLAGPVTLSVGYSSAWSRVYAGRETQTPGSHRAHQIDATVLRSLGRGFRLGGAFSAYSGAPFHRVIIECPSDRDQTATGCLADARTVVTRSPEQAERGPAYASLDLLLDWQRPYDTWSWGFYLQVRNLTATNNRGVYRGTFCNTGAPAGSGCGPVGGRDVFEPLLSIPLPTVGVRLMF